MKCSQAPFNQCMECDEIITNPICTECLADRMKLVVREYNEGLAEKISGLAVEGNTPCLFCGKMIALCAHCFAKDVYEMIHENNPEIAIEFAGRFDFDLRQEVPDFD